MKMDINKLKKVVNKTGFLAELEAGRCFLENKWDVKQNFYYFDNAEKKERELDVLASLTRPFDNKYSKASISLFCDVKKITDNKSWVIFTTERNQHDQRYDYLKIISKFTELTNKEIVKNTTLSQAKKYPKIGRTYSVISDKSKYEEDQIFTAIKASTNALKYYYGIENQNKAIIGNQNIRNNIVLKIMEPVIILKGSLYEIYLDKDNKECYEEVKRSIIAYNNICDNVIGENYLIEIVTIDELDNFLKEKKSWLQYLINDIFD
jgi:hypothetical protein